MAQIFHRSTNTISRVSVFGGIGIIAVLVTTLAAINRSSYVTDVGVARSQPVQFSHKHHVSDDGIDCRYCHTSVEESSFAGIPSTKICMNCHTQIWDKSPSLYAVSDAVFCFVAQPAVKCFFSPAFPTKKLCRIPTPKLGPGPLFRDPVRKCS